MTDVSSFGLTFLLREDWSGRLDSVAYSTNATCIPTLTSLKAELAMKMRH